MNLVKHLRKQTQHASALTSNGTHLQSSSYQGSNTSTSRSGLSSTSGQSALQRISNTSGQNIEPNDIKLLHDVPIESPLTSNLPTHGYLSALRNRIHESSLPKHGDDHIKRYTPVFIHDALMLPGSLANLLNLGPLSILSLMTPGLLPGYVARVDTDSQESRLMQSPDPNDYVRGMVVFGIDKDGRKLLHNHYHSHAKRKKLHVNIEVLGAEHQAFSPTDADISLMHARLQRCSIEAYTWVWRDRKKPEAMQQLSTDLTWTLDDYIAGKLEEKRTALRVSPDARGDEDADGYIGREMQETEIEKEQRPEVHGGAGGLDYERSSFDTGW